MTEPVDINPQELNLLQKKIERTNALKKDFLKQLHNPYRHASGEGGFVFDPAVQRYNALRAGGYERFKPTWKNGAVAFCTTILPMLVLGVAVYSSRHAKEHKFRTGQVSYADRDFKFQ